MKFTPTFFAALSRVLAYFTGSPPLAATSMAMGVTLMRLLTMGIPYFFSMDSPTSTNLAALAVILSYIFWQETSISLSAQSKRDIPMVMVRISRFSSWIMVIVSMISLKLTIIFSVRNLKSERKPPANSLVMDDAKDCNKLRRLQLIQTFVKSCA